MCNTEYINNEELIYTHPKRRLLAHLCTCHSNSNLWILLLDKADVFSRWSPYLSVLVVLTCIVPSSLSTSCKIVQGSPCHFGETQRTVSSRLLSTVRSNIMSLTTGIVRPFNLLVSSRLVPLSLENENWVFESPLGPIET